MSIDYQNMVKNFLKIKAEISSGEDFYKKSDIEKFNIEFSKQLKKATEISEKYLKRDLGDFKTTDLKNLRDDLACWENWHKTDSEIRPADLVKKIDNFLVERN